MARPVSNEQLLARRQLGSRLRSHRMVVGTSATELAGAIGMSLSKLSRLERGHIAISEEDVRSIARVLRLSEATTEGLVDEALGLIRSTALNFSGASQTFGEYYPNKAVKFMFETESQASELRCFDLLVLHGTLQTPEFTSELFEHLIELGCGEDLLKGLEVDDFRVVRARRQAALLDNRKRMHFLIYEAALRPSFISEKTMVDQYRRLLLLMSHPSVRIGIVPEGALRSVMQSDFQIFDEVMVFTETLTHSIVVQEPQKVRVYRNAFERAAAVALYDEAVETLLRRMIEQSTVDARDEPGLISGGVPATNPGVPSRSPASGSAG